MFEQTKLRQLIVRADQRAGMLLRWGRRHPVWLMCAFACVVVVAGRYTGPTRQSGARIETVALTEGGTLEKLDENAQVDTTKTQVGRVLFGTSDYLGLVERGRITRTWGDLVFGPRLRNDGQVEPIPCQAVLQFLKREGVIREVPQQCDSANRPTVVSEFSVVGVLVHGGLVSSCALLIVANLWRMTLAIRTSAFEHWTRCCTNCGYEFGSEAIHVCPECAVKRTFPTHPL